MDNFMRNLVLVFVLAVLFVAIAFFIYATVVSGFGVYFLAFLIIVFAIAGIITIVENKKRRL